MTGSLLISARAYSVWDYASDAPGDAGEPENAERGSRKAEQMGDLQVCLFRVPRSAFRVS